MTSTISVKIRLGFPCFAGWTILPIRRNASFLCKKIMYFLHSFSDLFGTSCPKFRSPSFANSIRQCWSFCIAIFTMHVFQIGFLCCFKKMVRINTKFIIARMTNRIRTLWNSMNSKKHSSMRIGIFSIRQPGISISRSTDSPTPQPTSIWQFFHMRFETVKKFFVFHAFMITKYGSIVKLLPGQDRRFEWRVWNIR